MRLQLRRVQADGADHGTSRLRRPYRWRGRCADHRGHQRNLCGCTVVEEALELSPWDSVTTRLMAGEALGESFASRRSWAVIECVRERALRSSA